ncbi:MAG: hypothetical protein ACLTQI_10070 [Slackia sp.]
MKSGAFVPAAALRKVECGVWVTVQDNKSSRSRATNPAPAATDTARETHRPRPVPPRRFVTA